MRDYYRWRHLIQLLHDFLDEHVHDLNVNITRADRDARVAYRGVKLDVRLTLNHAKIGFPQLVLHDSDETATFVRALTELSEIQKQWETILARVEEEDDDGYTRT